MLENSNFFAGLRPEILIDGVVVQQLSEHLLEMRVMSSVHGHAVVSMRFLNWGNTSSGRDPDFLFFDQTDLDFGRQVLVRVKQGSSAVVLFSGKVTAIEAQSRLSSPPELFIIAEDQLAEFGRRVQNRIFKSVTDRDMLSAIAGDYGLAADITVDGPTYEHVVQLNQTDLAFCFERVRAAGGELWIENDILHAKTRQDRMSGPLDLVMGKSLIEFQARADLQGQATEMRVTGWNVGMKQRNTGVANDTALGNNAVQQGQTAAKILKELTGEHTLIHEVKSMPAGGDQALTLARQFYRERSGAFVRATGNTVDTPELHVGTVVKISQVGSLFEGDYYLAAVTHTFSSLTGFQTEFEAERAWLNRKPSRRSKKEVPGGTTTRKKPTVPRKPTTLLRQPTTPSSRITSRPVVRRVPSIGQRRKRP